MLICDICKKEFIYSSKMDKESKKESFNFGTPTYMCPKCFNEMLYPKGV